MGQIKGIRIQTQFEKEVNRRKKENYELLVAKTTYKKNMLDIKTTK